MTILDLPYLYVIYQLHVSKEDKNTIFPNKISGSQSYLKGKLFLIVAVPVLLQASERANPPPRKSKTPQGIFFSTIFQVTSEGEFFGIPLNDWNGQNL